jgi:hypothetical protein
LDDTAFTVLGGNPADHDELWDNAKADLRCGRDARQVIGAHSLVCSTLCWNQTRRKSFAEKKKELL